jgi:uncharacterized membrane protein YfcA
VSDPLLVISIVLLTCQVIGGATGFAGAALSIPLIVLVLPLRVVLPMSAFIGLTLSACMAATHWRDIDLRQAARIVPLTLLGVLGNFVFIALPGEYVKICLGVFVGVIAIRGLLRRGEPRPWTGWKRYAALLLPFGGGVIHGAVNSGGPLVVAYAERVLEQKSRFRATLSLTFIPMNTCLIFWHAAAGRWTADTMQLTATVFPFAAVGWALGMILHGHLSQRVFRRLVLVLLLAVGCILVSRSVGQLVSAPGQAAAAAVP